MVSVTQRIKNIKQPRGGYINRKSFTEINIEDHELLNSTENIGAQLIGLVVDYMTRYLNGTDKKEAFIISLRGAAEVGELNYALELLENIVGPNDGSLAAACQLVGYDVIVRAGKHAYRAVVDIEPDIPTIENIRIMIMRSLKFIEEYGPVVKDGFTFEGGYTHQITSGDGDLLTESTLWDIKVIKSHLFPKYTLQLLIYYLMGMHSIHDEFDSIRNLGIYNPRFNTVYLLKLSDIPQAIIDEVETEVIGY